MPVSIDRGFKTDPLFGEPEYVRERQARLGKFDVIQSANYPANNENDHFVRFYINIDDESRLIRDEKVTVIGDADRTDQNRANRMNTSEDRVALLGGALGAAGGYIAGGNFSRAISNPNALIRNMAGWKGGAGRAMGRFADANPRASSILSHAVGAGAGVALGLAAASTLNVTKKIKRLGATITLYTPENIATDYRMNWSSDDYSMADLLSKDRGQEFVSNLGPGTKTGLPTKITRLIATNASPDIQLLSRTTKNPKKDYLFRDVEQRNFEFGYLFAPQSPKEAEEVARIIYMFKLFSHPELLEGYDNFLYVYPAEFDIVYGFRQLDENGEERSSLEQNNPYLHKISSCVLKGISLNYSPGGSFHSLRRGEPCMVRMTLAFSEIETLHQGRIEEGY